MRLASDGWPLVYFNRERGRFYRPHHEAERRAVFSDSPRYVLFRGGEGGGKTVAGIVKTLDRLRRGMSGAMVSPDFEHFKKSLWPEFRRWCPWQCVVERHQYRQSVEWMPGAAFELVFNNAVGTQSVLLCGGINESDVASWEGPNLNFVHIDEIRRHRTPAAIKVLDGRVRIPGPNGEPPQMWITTTPRKHWLYDYFGPIRENDPYAAFKRDCLDVILLTRDNAENLEAGFTEKRAQSLTAAEARVLLEAEWEDIESGERFLPTMLWWDECRSFVRPYDGEPIVLGVDAAVGRTSDMSDCFGIVGVTRHWEQSNAIVVRLVYAWQAEAGHKIDFLGTPDRPGPELVIRDLCNRYNVVCLTYDPVQLHDMATRLTRDGVVWCREFSQSSMRLESDRMLLDLISQRRIVHDGNELLRAHIDNADRRLDEDGHRLRIVKRYESDKIDLAVCLSMASYWCLKLNL